MEAGAIIPIAACYQYVDRSWWTLHIVSLSVTTFNVIAAHLCLAESAKFLHTLGHYDESSAVLGMVSRFNKSKSWSEALNIAYRFQTLGERQE